LRICPGRHMGSCQDKLNSCSEAPSRL
jgi:hypothetical protein